MSDDEQVVSTQEGGATQEPPPDPGWAPPGTVPEGSEEPAVEESEGQAPPLVNTGEIWGDPIAVARQYTAPQIPQQPQYVPPQPQTGPPVLDMARANVDLEGAMKDWSERMAAYTEAKTQERLHAVESRREAMEQANMVVGNLQIGSQMAEAVLGSDPAMQDPRVQTVVKQLIREAQVTAIDNPRASNAFRNEEFFVAILHRAKKAAGYQGKPVAARMDGARTLSGGTAGRAPAGAVVLTREEREFCAKERISERDYLENKKAALAEQSASVAPWRG